MFEYFSSDNYSWNQTLLFALAGGGNITEIDTYCRHLKELSKGGPDAAQEAWLESWQKLAAHVEELALRDEQGGYSLSAGRKYLRASMYYIVAERNAHYRDPRKLETYRKVLSTFKKGIQLGREPVEFVEVPFRESSLPCLFVQAPDRKRTPCMIVFDGLDVMKEILYLDIGHAYRNRGISLLIVDHPGVGEALRLRNMYIEHDTEVPAGACVDYLEGRSDVDPKRIGIVAPSLGGYYAPRAAAFEKRLKCCIAWGGFWAPPEWKFIGHQGADGATSIPSDHFLYVTGKDTVEEAEKLIRRLTLEGVADKITCPLLVVHGENDQLVSVAMAQKTIEAAVNSPARKLKIFTIAEGGAEHCQTDNLSMGIDYMADWVAETLGGNPAGV